MSSKQGIFTSVITESRIAQKNNDIWGTTNIVSIPNNLFILNPKYLYWKKK